MTISKIRAALVGAVSAGLVAVAGPALAAKPQPPPEPSYSYAQCRTVSGSAGSTELCVSVAPAGTANPDTSASVPVTVTCTSTAPGQVYYGNVRVWQDYVGPAPKTDQVLIGTAAAPLPCDGTADTFTVTTRPLGYHPGLARVIAQIGTQGQGGLTTVQVDTGDTVTLV